MIRRKLGYLFKDKRAVTTEIEGWSRCVVCEGPLSLGGEYDTALCARCAEDMDGRRMKKESVVKEILALADSLKKKVEATEKDARNQKKVIDSIKTTQDNLRERQTVLERKEQEYADASHQLNVHASELAQRESDIRTREDSLQQAGFELATQRQRMAIEARASRPVPSQRELAAQEIKDDDIAAVPLLRPKRDIELIKEEEGE